MGISALTNGLNEKDQLQIIKSYIEKSRFEDDDSGYFYVYKGTVCIAHPTQKQLIGKDLGNTSDQNGLRYVAELEKAVNRGGGFVNFVFPKPNVGNVTKIGYAERIPGTPFWIGTGVYIDNVDRAEQVIFTAMNDILWKEIRLFGGLFLLTLLLGGVPLSYCLITSITRPLTKTTQLARTVADGNLEAKILPEGKDEIAMLQQALCDMVATLKKHIERSQEKSRQADQAAQEAHAAMLQAENAKADAEKKTVSMVRAADKLEEVAHVVSSASAQLASRIEQSDRSTAESAQRLTEAAAAMNEMNATVRDVAQNASAASEVSAATKNKAEHGARVVQESLKSIEVVRDMSSALMKYMEHLNKHSASITNIITFISDIADQTNLLALNAAIEAARAGEAGRGFAVVADEVRKLAEKTMTSTTEVGSAIRAIQESTGKSMASMEAAAREIAQATNLATESGSALHEIVSNVESSADQVHAIAAASEEQSAASDEINATIAQINTMMHQTAEAMREAAGSVAHLAAQARGLTELVTEMKKE